MWCDVVESCVASGGVVPYREQLMRKKKGKQIVEFFCTLLHFLWPSSSASSFTAFFLERMRYAIRNMLYVTYILPSSGYKLVDNAVGAEGYAADNVHMCAICQMIGVRIKWLSHLELGWEIYFFLETKRCISTSLVCVVKPVYLVVYKRKDKFNDTKRASALIH